MATSTAATFSVENAVQHTLDKLSIPQRTFAMLVGISVGQLNEILSGRKSANGHDKRFRDTVRLVEQLDALMGGLPLDWSPKNGKHFKLVLEALDKDQFRISIEDLTNDNRISESAASIREARLRGLMEGLGTQL